VLEQREPLQIGTDELAEANALFGSFPEVMESAIVSTCNRGEFYFVTGSNNDPFEIVKDFYKKFKDLDLNPYRKLFFLKKGKHVADHLFRVAAGIDSMVLGENQIMGQVKDAYSSSCAVKSAGKIIHRLFHQSFRVAKRVRTDTEIGKGACSVSTAAVEKIKGKLEEIKDPTVLLIGVNQTIGMAANRIKRMNGCRLIFANRTAEKAVAFARAMDCEGYGLDQLPELLAQCDVVVSSTSSPDPLVDGKIMSGVVEARAGRELVVVDLAVPRDFDLPKDFSPLVQVNDLEDIKKFVSDRQYQRETALPQAEKIIDRRLGEFGYWYEHVLHEPIYNGRSHTMETIREEELGPVLEKLPPELQNELNQAARRIVERVIRATNRPVNRRPGKERHE
jgi:glutamyl-tRNA reductase